jgi:hypothetical protein
MFDERAGDNAAPKLSGGLSLGPRRPFQPADPGIRLWSCQKDTFAVQGTAVRDPVLDLVLRSESRGSREFSIEASLSISHQHAIHLAKATAQQAHRIGSSAA